VNLIVYDILGREITTLENSRLASGYYEESWKGVDASGKQVSSGVYFYRLHAIGESGKEYSKVMKMMMVK
jgi:flagellar hook assembly protein FlgD